MPPFDFLNPVAESVKGGIFPEGFKDPNLIQTIGDIGQGISQGQSIGEVLNPSNVIRNVQTQKAASDVSQGNQNLMNTLRQILNPVSPVAPAAQNLDPNTQDFGEPTPIGQAGPDSVTTKKTADGTTTTISTPSKRNLETFGTNVPIEAQASPQEGVGDIRSPFSQALRNLA